MSVGSASGRSNPLLNGRTRNGKKPAVKKRKTVYDGGVVKSSRKSKTNVRSSGKGPRHVDVADQAMPKVCRPRIEVDEYDLIEIFQ